MTDKTEFAARGKKDLFVIGHFPFLIFHLCGEVRAEMWVQEAGPGKMENDNWKMTNRRFKLEVQL